MIEYDLREVLVTTSSALRTFCVIAAAIAINDVVRHGLCIKRVSLAGKAYMMFVMFCFAVSGASSIARLSDLPVTMVFRELSHSALSVALIGLAAIVVRANHSLKEESIAQCTGQCETSIFTPAWYGSTPAREFLHSK